MIGKSQENPRVAALLRKLAARTNPDGSPKPGYQQNVASIRAALAELQPAPEAAGGK